MLRVSYKSSQEIQLIQKSAEILSHLLGKVFHHVQPNVETKQLEQIARDFLKEVGAQSSFKGYKGYPAVLCISVNEEVVHGLPGDYTLQKGDVISIDCGVYHKGYHADSAFTSIVGGSAKAKNELVSLVEETEVALNKGIDQTKAGQRIGDIGYAINQHAKSHGFSVIRNYGGHGLGKKLHEPPYIPNFGRRGTGSLLKEGMVLAIEPIIKIGASGVFRKKDGWTVVTEDKNASAHFEHTVAIVDGKAKILTSFEHIKEKINGK